MVKIKLSGVHRLPPTYPWPAIVGPFIAYFVGVAIAQSFYSGPVAMSVARGLGGHVDIMLVAGGVSVSLVVLAFWGCRIAFADAGLISGTLRRAALQGAVIWGIGQVTLVTYNLATGEPLAISEGWRGPMLAGQELVFQFFGVALLEEWVFRGWLIPQVYRRLRPRISEWQALGGAVLIVGTVFAACHIPMLFVSSNEPIVSQLIHIEVLGIVYSLCYLRTGGISVGIAFHVLSNIRASLFDSPLFAGDIYGVLFWLWLLFQPAFVRRWGRAQI